MDKDPPEAIACAQAEPVQLPLACGQPASSASTPTRRRSALVDGFSLHANTSALAYPRSPVTADPRDQPAPDELPFDDTIASATDLRARASLQAFTMGDEGRHTTTVVATPVEALRAEEATRTRMFVRIALVIVLGALIAVGIAGGDPVARVVVAGGCGVVTLTGLWFLTITRDPANFTVRRSTIGAAIRPHETHLATKRPHRARHRAVCYVVAEAMTEPVLEIRDSRSVTW